MARPRKKYKALRNGDSLQCFIGDRYVGSISVRQLCINLEIERLKNTSEVNPQ